MPDNIRQTLRDVTRFRLLLVAVAALGMLVVRPAAMQPGPLLVVAATSVVYLAAVHSLIFPRFVSTGLVLATVIADVVFFALALYFSGGLDSVLLPMYPLAVVYSAMLLGYLGAFTAATAVTIALSVLLNLSASPTGAPGFIALNLTLVYLLAALSGYLVHTERAQRKQATELGEMLNVERGAKDILTVTRDLNSMLDSDEILPKVAAVASQVTGLSRCLFILPEEQRNHGADASAGGQPQAGGQERLAETIAALVKSGPVHQVLQSGNPLLVEDAATDARLPYDSLAGVVPRSFMLLPLTHRDTLLGVMYLDDGGMAHTFTREEVRLARAFGDQAAVAIANARRYREAQGQIQNLVAEIRAVAQRKEAGAEGGADQKMSFDGLMIDSQLRRASVNGKAVNLSWTEFELLHFLASSPDAAFSRETIFRKVWKQEYYISTNLVDVCVHRLRQKLEANPAEPRYVVTVHGVGYMFVSGAPSAADE